MKAALLFTGGSPVVILTSHDSIESSQLIGKLEAKGIDKFIAYEIPLHLARARYGGHFDVVMDDLRESDDLRILDYNGQRAFRLFRLEELGEPFLHEGVPLSQPA